MEQPKKPRKGQFGCGVKRRKTQRRHHKKNTIPREGAVRQEERDLARETKVASIQAAHAVEMAEVRSEVGPKLRQLS